MESYPVIPRSIMTSMITYSSQLLSSSGQIVLIMNLLESKSQLSQFPALIKPYLKYFPFVWVDFGRPTLKEDFEKLMNECQMEFKGECMVRTNVQEVFQSFGKESKVY